MKCILSLPYIFKSKKRKAFSKVLINLFTHVFKALFVANITLTL